MLSIIVILVLCACLVFAITWGFFLFKKLGSKEDSVHYYETYEWRNGENGIQYAQADEKMDSLVYIPNRNKVCWFHGRTVADVQPNGTFVLKWSNGGRMSGSIKPLDQKIELVGIPGTSEDGVTEKMALA